MKDDDKPGIHLVSLDGDVVQNEASTKPEHDHTLEDDGANDEAIRIKLTKLETEHGDLDLAITSLEERMPYDRVTIQRLKKRKLALKDEIAKLHALILPDIIA